MRLNTSLAGPFALLVLSALLAMIPVQAVPEGENLETFAQDCVTPKKVFAVGDSVCAVAAEAPLGPPTQRRFEWVAPDGTIFQLGPDIIADPQSDSITIPKAGPFSQVGTWTVKTVNASNNGLSVARFVVHDPSSSSSDLSVSLYGSAQVTAGSTATFNLRVTVSYTHLTLPTNREV